MVADVQIAVLIVAIGTYLMRALPLSLMTAKQKEITFGRINRFVSLSGPALISALLVVSALPAPNEFTLEEVLRRTLAITAVIIAQRRWSNLGAAVVTGVVIYALFKISY